MSRRISSKLSNLSTLEVIAVVLLLLVLGFGILSLKAWLLGIILGWFSVSLGFWKCFLIVFLIDLLFARSSSN